MCLDSLGEKKEWMSILKIVKDKFTIITPGDSLEGTAVIGSMPETFGE